MVLRRKYNYEDQNKQMLLCVGTQESASQPKGLVFLHPGQNCMLDRAFRFWFGLEIDDVSDFIWS